MKDFLSSLVIAFGIVAGLSAIGHWALKLSTWPAAVFSCVVAVCITTIVVTIAYALLIKEDG